MNFLLPGVSRHLFSATLLLCLTASAGAQSAGRNASGPLSGNSYAYGPQSNAELMREAQQRTVERQQESQAAITEMKADAAARRAAGTQRQEALRRSFEIGRQAIDKATTNLIGAISDNDPSDLHPHPSPQPRSPGDPVGNDDGNADEPDTNPADQVDTAAREQQEVSKQEWDKLNTQIDEALAGIRATPAKLSRTADEIRESISTLEKYGAQLNRTVPRLDDDPTQLYLDEYPQPPKAKDETASDWWRERVKNGDSANQLYLVEPGVAQRYDEDGLPITPGTPASPNALPNAPRYEKMSPWQRRRLEWLPDSPDQLYLVE